jgi:membrane-associated protease RseP (regulator of RpoE activity)
MPLVIGCPSCKAKLKAPDNAVGKAVKCPSCGTAIAVKAPAGVPGSSSAASRQPAGSKAPTPRRPEPNDDYEVVEEDDRPRQGKGRSEPDEDDRPRKSTKAREDDEYDDEDRPSKPTAYLGAGFSLDTDDLEITNIYEDSPADRAGLKVGDLIVRLDNKKVSKRTDLAAFLSKRKPGDEITVDVQTADEAEVTIDVKLGRRATE